MSNESQKANPMVVSYALPNGENITLDAQTVRNFLTNGDAKVSDKEVVMYVQLCKAQQLNPFLKEAYLIKYSENQPASIVVAKDAFMKRAESHPQYGGMKSGVIVLTKNGEIKEREGSFYLPNESVVGGWAKVFRNDRKSEIYDSVAFDEYAGKDKNGNLNSMWRGKPGTMIQKVAEVHAMRKAFPERLSGLYIEDEMGKSQVVSTMNLSEQQAQQYDLSGMEEIDEPTTVTHDDGFEQYGMPEDDMDAYMDEIADKYAEEEEAPKQTKTNEPFQVSYYEYVNNKDKYKLVPKSYDAAKKTCMVTYKEV